MQRDAPCPSFEVVTTIDGLVETRWLRHEGPLPLLIQASDESLDAATWASSNKDWLEARLLNHGGLLFRNFRKNSMQGFERFILTFTEEMLDYTNRSTPRSRVEGKIYTSTEYPPAQSIPLHNELAYSREWPMKIWFMCVTPAEEGGETPIADSRAVYNRIDRKIREKFSQKKVMYTRNYGYGLDLPWQSVFQTESRSEVEAYCRHVGIQFEWGDRERLRTRQVCQAVARHPRTGDMVWFNQAHLFHVSNLRPEVRESLLSVVPEEDLPRNAYYGDGTPIEPAALEAIRDTLEQEAVIFPWQEGDLMMLDNMLTAHGREPFVGARRVVVAMAEPFSEEGA